MEIHNNTPFPELDFDAADNRGPAFHVVVARATYDILDNGVLRRADEQRPLVVQDDATEESDLAPFKPQCDVVVIGNAVAPGGKAVGRFDVGIAINRKGTALLNKRLAITGPRFWEKRFLPFLGWRLTTPEPISSLPLRYEYAYGGECRVESNDPSAHRVKKKFQLTLEQRAAHPDGAANAPIAHTCFGANTVGRGYAEEWYLKAKRLRRVPAAQIESVSDPIQKFPQSHAPQGFGYLPKSSASRIRFAGTMDDAFIQSGKSLPDDFDFAYWNGTPPDMQIPWLEGNEEIILTHMGVETPLVLPEHKLCAEVTYHDGTMAGLDFKVDTLIINTEQKTVSLVFRLKLPPEPDVQSLVVQQLSAQQRELLLEEVQTVNEKVQQYAQAL